MAHDFEVTGTVFIGTEPGRVRECHSVVTYSAFGAETWPYVDKSNGELVLAERIDGGWYDLDLDEAREEFADVLYCV